MVLQMTYIKIASYLKERRDMSRKARAAERSVNNRLIANVRSGL